MKKCFVGFITASLISGCGGNLKSFDCSTDWNALGEELAMKGVSVREFYTYKEHCGERIGEQEKAAYVDGWTVGIIKFCTFDNGYEFGSTNKVLPEVCPTEVRREFEQGYAMGKRELDENLQKMQRQTDKADNAVWDRRDVEASQGTRN